MISIGEVSIYEANANAEVAETITYEKNGVTNTATVTHKLFLVPNNNNVPVICADLYFEEFSGFKSCSYVDETRSSAMIAVEGSGSCIVHTAEAELGEGEDANGQTKYGIWYGKPTANWCAIFVSWCANQSNIATSIIPRTEGPSVLKSRIQYCARSNAVGANAPQTGDLVYFSWTGTNLDHVGIVRWADASSIYVVHGNNSNGVVAYWTVSRTDARIDGYGKPAYANAGHTGVPDVAEDFYYDSAEHWVLCINCGHACENEPHDLTYTTTLTKHKASCSTCEYEGTYVNHHSEVYDWDDTKHWKYCDACDAYFASGTHNLVATNVSWMYVCSECEYETRITRSVDETSE